MNEQREMLHTHKAHCDDRARGLRAYVRELGEMVAKHGTDEALVCEDLAKAKFDLEFYETQSAGLCEALEDGLAAFHVYEDAKGEWRWRLKASNGRVVADSGEGYRDKADCLHGIEIVKGSKESPVKED
jgi:uncharacterized protein YegP (UPF0339 family)